MSEPLESVWIFNGTGAQFPSAVFTSKEAAARWIEKYQLSGVLTSYPVDESVLEWATRTGHFVPKNEKHTSPEFIQRFTTAARDHFSLRRWQAGMSGAA